MTNFTKKELENQYLISHIENYYPHLNYEWKEILVNYFSIILEYLKIILDQGKPVNPPNEKIAAPPHESSSYDKKYKINKKNLKSIILRGIETISHVFCLLLYYTKNLKLTYYNTQKAYYYYVEFIEQISEEQIAYLKLNTNDAILYVYKKTIYQINNEYRKSMPLPDEKTDQLFSRLNEMVSSFKKMMFDIFYQKTYLSTKEQGEGNEELLINDSSNEIKHHDLFYHEMTKKIEGVFQTLCNQYNAEVNHSIH